LSLAQLRDRHAHLAGEVFLDAELQGFDTLFHR
jgi:hypothetical protein